MSVHGQEESTLKWKDKYASVNILHKYMLSYGLVFLIPLSVAIIICYNMISNMEKEVLDRTLRTLEHGRDILEERLAEVKNITYQLSYDNYINKIYKQENVAYNSWLLKSELDNYLLTNNFIESINVYFPSTDLMISNQLVTDHLEAYYRGNYQSGSVDYKEWKASMTSRNYYMEFLPASDITRNNRSERLMTCVHSVSDTAVGEPRAVIMMFIKEERIREVIKNYIFSEEWMYIANHNGKIIFSSDIKKMNDKFSPDYLMGKGKGDISILSNLAVSYSMASDSSWLYAAAFPAGEVLAEVNFLEKIVVAIILAVIIIGFLAAYFLANSSINPIRKVIETITSWNANGPKDNGNVFEYLQGSISELIQNNKDLKAEMQKKIPIIRSAFMDRLLRGEFNTADELDFAMKNAGIKMCGKRYVVLVLKISGYGVVDHENLHHELNTAKLMVSRVAEYVLGKDMLMNDINQDRLAILFDTDMEDNVRVRSIVTNTAHQIYTMLNEKNNIRIIFGAGTAYSNLLDIYRSYNEAIDALDHFDNTNDQILRWYSPKKEVDDSLYYPLEIERKLINLVCTGEKKLVMQQLDRIYKENILRRTFSKEPLQQLYHAFSTTITRIVSNLTDQNIELVSGEISALYHSPVNQEESWEKICTAFGKICDSIAQTKKKRTVQLKESILLYLNKEFYKADISLYMVASAFGITEVYLSTFFKEQTGENFQKYLENLRISKAKEMLESTDMTILEIAEKVGYTSAHSFRRAYKRFYGVLPSAER